MIFKSLSRTVFVCALSCAALAAQVIDPVATYPYLTVSPAVPVAGADSVVLKLSLGTTGNSCMAPTFTGLSFAVVQSPLAIYPPIYNVTLTYTLVPVPPNKICPKIYAPVYYGPSFALGKLALGTYSVTDQVTKKLVGTFSVAGFQQGSKDTVYVTPLNPATKDSLHFDLFNATISCCAQYHNNSVSVSDSVIMLSFQYLENPACACFIAGSHTAFACGPRKAGKYVIYKSQSMYCATPPCPLGLVQLVKVGEVTVGSTAVALPVSGTAMVEGIAVRQSAGTVHADFIIKQAGPVRITMFNSRGIAAGQLCNGRLPAGQHRFSWTAASPGAYFMAVEINGSNSAAKAIVVAR